MTSTLTGLRSMCHPRILYSDRSKMWQCRFDSEFTARLRPRVAVCRQRRREGLSQGAIPSFAFCWQPSEHAPPAVEQEPCPAALQVEVKLQVVGTRGAGWSEEAGIRRVMP